MKRKRAIASAGGRRLMIMWAALLATALAAVSCVEAEAAAVLVADGEARSAIVLPAEASDLERQAADELIEHVELISGAVLPVVSEGELVEGALPIRLGGAADAGLEAEVREAGENRSAFALVVDEQGVSIRGLSDEGTLFGVYELLEQLGVRWYMPGELGRVLPELATVAMEEQRTIQVPSMDMRRLQAIPGEGWAQRVRLGGDIRSTGAHGMPGNPPSGTGRQDCLSGDYAPGALEAVVGAIRDRHDPTDEKFYVGMGPHDGGGYCQCEGCRALDQGVYDPLYDDESMTDRYVWFFNQVLEELEDEYPNLHIVWYVYAQHMMPPAIEPNPRIVGVFAPISIDRIRGMDNPMSPDRHIFRWIIDEWSATNPNEMYYRGYYNNLACVQLPKTQIDRVRNEIPEIHAKGVNVMRVEVIHNAWATDPLTLYLATRLMWDVDTDVDAVLDEFYARFYGPAEAPMREYHERLEAAFRDTPYFTGSSWLYFPIFLDHPRRDELRGLLDEAESMVAGEDSPYAERVWMIRQGYERMDLFLDMMLARNAHDYGKAHEKMEAYDRLTQELGAYELESGHHLVHARENRPPGQGSYFSRFFRSPIVTAYERTVEQGDLVAGLPDEWDFLIDPVEIGEIAGYQREGELGGNWQPLLTSSRSWSDQGLHYYKGVAWYRTTVTIPEEFEGRPIYLWFAGVDNAARVWVNGELLGTNREPLHGLPGVAGTFRPFDFLATDAVRFGEENTVSVKVTNDRLAELGTGGLMGPVMFWSPRDPEWGPGN